MEMDVNKLMLNNFERFTDETYTYHTDHFIDCKKLSARKTINWFLEEFELT